MSDIDTSLNRDPSPTHDELLAIRDRMLARMEAGEPHRLIRCASLAVSNARFVLQKRAAYHEAHPIGRKTQVRRAFGALETAEHLGLDRTGLVVETVEVGS